MRRLAFPALLALCACGPATGPAMGGGASVPAEVIATGDGVHVSTTAETRTVTHEVTAPPERVWQVLPEIYREIGLPGSADANTRTVASQSATFTRRIIGEPATRFFDCGRGQFGVEIAATYTIHVTARTTVQPGPTPAASQLETVVQAYARNNDGANALLSHCHSRGLLEGLIALRVLEKLGASR